jgi:hypothetical protein
MSLTVLLATFAWGYHATSDTPLTDVTPLNQHPPLHATAGLSLHSHSEAWLGLVGGEKMWIVARPGVLPAAEHGPGAAKTAWRWILDGGLKRARCLPLCLYNGYPRGVLSGFAHFLGLKPSVHSALRDRVHIYVLPGLKPSVHSALRDRFILTCCWA